MWLNGLKAPTNQPTNKLTNPLTKLSARPAPGECKSPPVWRYSEKPTPVDAFSARGNPQQAWRAMLGLDYIPYLFPTVGPDSQSHRLLEVIFRNPSRVDALKVGGLGEVGEITGMWGAVTKFSMLYKDPGTGEWEYYTDTVGTPRVRTYNGRWVVVGGGGGDTIQYNTARHCGHTPGEDVQRLVGGGGGDTIQCNAIQYNTSRLCG